MINKPTVDDKDDIALTKLAFLLLTIVASGAVFFSTLWSVFSQGYSSAAVSVFFVLSYIVTLVKNLKTFSPNRSLAKINVTRTSVVIGLWLIFFGEIFFLGNGMIANFTIWICFCLINYATAISLISASHNYKQK
jgi:hypothetical protein